MKHWFLVGLLALPAMASAADAETDDGSLQWWVDLRGSLTAAVPDLEHPNSRDIGPETSALATAGPIGGPLYAPPTRLLMDDLVATDLAWARGLLLGGGLSRDLPGQGSLELVVGTTIDLFGRNLQLRDRGTRLRLGWPLLRGRLVLDLLPFDSASLEAADGGTTRWLALDPWRHSLAPWSQSLAPGAQLAHLGRAHELFLALRGAWVDKSVEQGTEVNTEKRGSYALIAGGALRLFDRLRLHLSLGHSVSPPTFARESLRGDPTGVRGASLGLTWGNLGLPTPRGQRLPLLAEPSFRDTFLDPPVAEGSAGWQLALEWSWLQEKLEDLDRRGQTVWQPAWILAAQLQGQWRGWSGELGYRDASVTFLSPGGIVPYVVLPSGQEARDEHRVYLAGGRGFADGRLLMRLALGLQRPASLGVEAISAGPNPGVPVSARRTAVIRGPGRIEVLPEGAEPVLELDARAELAWRITDDLVLGAQVFVRQSGNRVVWTQSPAGETVPTFADPFSVGVNLALRFRFAADSAPPLPRGTLDAR